MRLRPYRDRTSTAEWQKHVFAGEALLEIFANVVAVSPAVGKCESREEIILSLDFKGEFRWRFPTSSYIAVARVSARTLVKKMELSRKP